MKKDPWVIFSILLLLILPVCGGKTTPTATPTLTATATPTSRPVETTPTRTDSPAEKMRIIFEDDGSPDGTTALLYLLSHPDVNLQAVSISYGEAHPAVYIQHIGRVIDSLGLAGIPLGYGQDAPLSGINGFPESIRQMSSNFWGLPIPKAGRTYQAVPSAELLVGLLNASPVPVMVFESGPLTNLAQALRLDPAIRAKISAVYLMGGAVYVPGNIADFYPDNPNKVAEWNIFGDVQAASEVFESGVPIVLVPLDATNQVVIDTQDTAQWRTGGGPAALLAADFYDMMLNSWNNETFAIWDLMTAVLMLDPELCPFQPLHLDVVTGDVNTEAQTVVVSGAAPNASVCLQPDADGIRQNLIDVFSASATGTTPGTPGPTANGPPAGQLFRDDFSGDLQTGWTWQDEVPALWSITPDGWLQITGEDDALVVGGRQSNLLCRPAPQGDYQVTVHLSADPVENFQQAALILYQDGMNYIVVNRGFCSVCLEGGKAVFMDNNVLGSSGTYRKPTQATDVWLRLVNQDRSITGYYAFEQDDWQLFGEADDKLQTHQICLGVTNMDREGTLPPILVGRFDYIEISQP